MDAHSIVREDSTKASVIEGIQRNTRTSQSYIHLPVFLSVPFLWAYYLCTKGEHIFYTWSILSEHQVGALIQNIRGSNIFVDRQNIGESLSEIRDKLIQAIK